MSAATMKQNYTFAAQPKAVQSRAKYRTPDGLEPERPNLMWDKRVARGSNYAPRRILPPPDTASSRASSRRRTGTGRRSIETAESVEERVPTPPPVAGRHHMIVQTDNYLEDLRERITAVDFGTQTEAEADRPDLPLFEPKSSGLDIFTWINDGDLFDFDQEVEPVLDAVTRRSLDQALMEVLEEEEISEMSDHRNAFNQLRNVKLAELQRIAAKDARFEAEKQRRLDQAIARVDIEKSEMIKAAAATAAKELFDTMQDNVLMKLADAGYFYDPVLRQVQNTFLPWLVKNAGQRLDKVKASRQQVDNLLSNAASGLAEERSSSVRELKKRVESVAQHVHAEKARYVREQAEYAAAVAQAEADAVARREAAEAAKMAEAEAKAAAATEGEEGDGEGEGDGAAPEEAPEPEAEDEDDGEGDEGEEKIDEFAVVMPERPPGALTTEPVDPNFAVQDFGILAMAVSAGQAEERRLRTNAGLTDPGALDMLAYRQVYADPDGAAQGVQALMQEEEAESVAAAARKTSDVTFRAFYQDDGVEEAFAMRQLNEGSRKKLVQEFRGLTPTLGLQTQAHVSSGVFVRSVEKLGAGCHASIVVGDVVCEVNNVAVNTPKELSAAEAKLMPGMPVSLTVLRGVDGRREMVLVETFALEKAQAEVRAEFTEATGVGAQSTVLHDAVSAKAALNQLIVRLGFKLNADNQVIEMEAGGAASRSQLVEGSVITNVNGVEVSKGASIEALVKDKTAGEVMKVTVEGQDSEVVLELGAAGETVERVRALRVMCNLPIASTLSVHMKAADKAKTLQLTSKKAVDAAVTVAVEAKKGTTTGLDNLTSTLGFSCVDASTKDGAMVTTLSITGGAVQSFLCTGDIVLEVDDQTITTADELRNVESQARAGDVLKFKIRRGVDSRLDLLAIEVAAVEIDLSVVREKRREADLPVNDTTLMDQAKSLALLKTFKPIAGFRISDEEGVTPHLLSVEPQGAADRAGAQTGDVFVTIDGAEVKDTEGYFAASSKHTAGNAMNIVMKRGDSTVEYAVELGGKLGDEVVEVEKIRCLRAIAGLPLTGGMELATV